MLKSLLVKHVIMCRLIVEVWFQCIFVSGVRCGRFSHFFDLLARDGEQWIDQRGKKQVLEQLQNHSNNGEEFDLEENDPLFDSGSSFELVSVPGIQPTPSSSLGVTAYVLFLSMI